MKPLLRYCSQKWQTFDVYRVCVVEIQMWNASTQLWMYLGRVGTHVVLTYYKIPSVNYVWYTEYEFILGSPPVNGRIAEILVYDRTRLTEPPNESCFLFLPWHKIEYRIPIENKDILKIKRKRRL